MVGEALARGLLGLTTGKGTAAMNNDFFQVKPVTSYDGARYPSAYAGASDGEMEETHHPLTLLLALVLVLGLMVGLIGCYQRSDYVPETPEPDGGPGDGGPDPDCDDGEVRCHDGRTVQRCQDEEWTSQSCDDYCRDNYGPDAYSEGCDAEAADPCQCQYDIIGGVVAECEPGDIMCQDEGTLLVCEGGYDYVTYNCHERCREEHGPEWSSAGCDTDADDPCQCFYDVLEGDAPVCTPGDMYCRDDGTIMICEDDMLVSRSCDDLCREEHGEGWSSAGCDVEADDPCQCEFDTLDGGAPFCSPGDVICLDDDTLVTCPDGDYNEEDCDVRCAERYGDEYVSTGCDAEADEPCLCVIVDSGGEE